LADWSRQRRPVAWLSLDAGDNDPVRFWRHAAAALDRVRPGVTERVAPLLGLPTPTSLEGAVTAVVNELAAQPGDVLFVLDDYHLIEAESVHTLFLFLLEHGPPDLHVVVASRSHPPLPLARLRACGRLAELRTFDLRFTTEEAASLLREAVGSGLPDEAAAILAARTEGWAAGLQLAALSLRGQPDVAGFVATFSGNLRYILDYLTEEVLEDQTERVRGFLLETSVLDRLSAELCDSVTGRSDSQQMLEAIERANLFLIPLDEVRGWWRYHQLFADLLRTRLQQQQRDRALELHHKAAAWCEQRGLADDAVRHALASGDATRAARLVERHTEAVLLRGESATAQRWLAALPAHVVGCRPRLLLAQALLALLGGHVDEVEAPLDAAERAAAAFADEPFEPSVGKAASALANIPAAIALDRAHLAELRGDAERAIAFGRKALAAIGEDKSLLGSIARGRLAVALWLGGRLEEAERGLVAIAAEWRRADERFLAMRGYHYLGQVQRTQGRLDAAIGTYRQALKVAAAPGQAPLPAAGAAYVGLAELAYQRGELDAALRHLNEGLPLCRQLTDTQSLATGLAKLAWVRQARGDATGAVEAMDEAVRHAHGPGVAHLLNPVPIERAWLLLAQGDISVAVRWTMERSLKVDDPPNHAREPEYLLLARVLVAQDRPDQALQTLTRLRALAIAQGRMGSLIEIQALQALALAARGDQADAVPTLADALMLAHSQGYVRVFVDEGSPMRALLGLVIAAQRELAAARAVPVHYLGRLAQAFEQDAAPGVVHAGLDRVAARGPATRLSARELEVLHLLAAGKRNQEIANELYVAVSTVKKHLTHVFDKLGAGNRTEAIARARQLGLLR
jgi:LuxR family maltose regulon positive regulatory protein